MGHYSLFPLFLTLGISTPAISAEAYTTTTCEIRDGVSVEVKNNVGFPLSCMVRFKFAAQKELPAVELFWYDGGMRPFVPDELAAEGKTFAREGMMFVGDKGRVLAGFRGENPVLIPESKMKSLATKPAADAPDRRGNEVWAVALKNYTQSPGSFLYAGPVTETILLSSCDEAGKRLNMIQ
jgi:hypothetical protein